MVARHRRRARAARLLGMTLWAMAAGHVAEALWLRHRRGRLAALGDAKPGAEPPAVDESLGSGKVRVVAVEGAVVDEETLAAATAEMAASGSQVMDLVPAELPADRALRLLRWVNPDKFGQDPLHARGGAHEALVLAPSVAERMGLAAAPSPQRLGRSEMVRATLRAQRHAISTSTLRVAPGLRAGPVQPDERWCEWEQLTASDGPNSKPSPLLAGLETAHLLAMTAGLLVAPPAALAAVATWSAQPLLVFGSRHPASDQPRLTPPQLGRASLLRLLRTWSGNVRVAAAGRRKTRAAYARLRAAPRPHVPPENELFEPRQDTCPWCGSGSLAARLDIPDLLQHKPGRFHLDECTRCGHTFQNPALSPTGLDYYYQDFYDGLGDEHAESLFSLADDAYQARLDAVARFTRPQAWLDVGTGYGHFCLAGRQRWPGTVFDALDMGESVAEGQRRGWVDTAYRGLFTELADGMPRSHDVVSMHHYLEHTRDPRLELVAAAKVLEPGGYLEIEVPDPQSPWARRLGRYWFGWSQPQHLHLVPCDNLIEALTQENFDVVSVERGTATLGHDLSIAVILGTQGLTRSPHVPWLPPPSLADRAQRGGVFVAAAPVFALAAVSDEVKDAFTRLSPNAIGNTYRIVARRI